MNDSFLLDKIAGSLKRICEEHNLHKIKEVVVEVSYNSRIEETGLHKHLVQSIPELVDGCTIIAVKKTSILEQTAVIYMLKGGSAES